MNTELKYRTFQDLLNEVLIDLPIYDKEGMVEPAQLIKIAQKCNYDLGLRIHSTKSIIIDVFNKKARLPDDFYVLNYALICSKSYKYYGGAPGGTHREDIKITCSKCDPCPPSSETNDADPCDVPPENNCCMCDKVYTNECGETFMVVQKKGFDITVFEEFNHIRLKPGKVVDKNCFNSQIQSSYVGEIKNGYLYTNLEHGKIFLSFQGTLEDDEGNLLVLDHPMINEYYEYAIKNRLLENLYFNGEDVVQKLQLTEERLRVARNNALGIVNTPDFKEMYDLWKANRTAQYRRFYAIFK